MCNYDNLKDHLLKVRGTKTLKLTFTDIAEICECCESKLCETAYDNKDYWANNLGRTLGGRWLEADWKKTEVNLKEQYVVLQKTN